VLVPVIQVGVPPRLMSLVGTCWMKPEASPEPVTNRELTAALGRALRRPTLLPTPKPALWARGGRELTEALLYSSSRVEPALLLRRRFQFTHPDIATGLAAVLAH